MTEIDTRDLVGRFGREIGGFLGAADRTTYRSTLFDMRKRTLLGMYCLYDHASWYLDEIAVRMEPTDLGRSLRRLAARPYTPLVNTPPWAFLACRENDLLMGREIDDGMLRQVIHYWADVAFAYRGDGALLPSEAGFVNRVLPHETLSLINSLLDQAPQNIELTQRTAARLETMNFVISGEIRGRNFFHGPYPGTEPGTSILVQEFTELRHRQQPWIEGLLGFPFDNVVIVREVEAIDATFDLFGFMVVNSGNYPAAIRRAAVLTVGSGGVHALESTEVEALSVPAQDAIRGAYSRIVAWTDDFRILYGLYHYLNEVAPFAEAVGAPELIDELRSRMEESGERRLADVVAMGDVPPVWAKWASGGSPFTLPEAAESSASLATRRSFERETSEVEW